MTKKLDAINYFDNSHHRRNLKDEAIQGGAIVVAARGFTTIIHIGGTVVLARLLTPNDFGLVAMVSALTEVLFLFRDAGLTDATIQASSINHKQVSTLFWINLAICLFITILLIALSPAVVWFYKNKRLMAIMMVSSASYVFWGLSFQHMALLKRNMLFFRVSMIGILAQLVSTSAAVVLALAGSGYWAIVMREIIFSILTCILAWIYCSWRPGLPAKTSDVFPMLKFGANSAGFYIVSYFAKNVDKIIVGKKFGSIPLGLYSRAYYLATTPNTQISEALFHVSVSTLSKIRQDTDKYRRYYLNAISAISFVGMPLGVLMVLMSKELVLLLLGPQWSGTARLFSILGLAAGMNILYYTVGWLHVSLGRSDRWLRWGIFSAIILAAACVIGMFFGPKGIAWGYTLAIITLTLPGVLYAGRPIGLSFNKVLSKIWKNILAAILGGLLLNYLNSQIILTLPLFLSIMISSLSYLAIFLAIITILNRGITPIKELYSLSRIVISKRNREERTSNKADTL